MYRSISIVVLYNPSEEIINKWKSYVCRMTRYFFLFVDNSERTVNSIDGPNSFYLTNKKNLGIAAAQNIGIKYAIENHFDYVVFFDQDSEFDDLYIEKIIGEFIRIQHLEPKIAVVGPTAVNKDSFLEYKYRENTNKENYAVVSNLISSGTVVKVSVFKTIGMMEESLFIDYVDFEWCWRAISKGFLCARTHNVSLLHKVGSSSISILGRTVIISAPVRYFYQYRNFLCLIKRNYVPKRWKIKTFVRKFMEIVVLPWVVRKKIETIKYVFKGIKAGVIRK